MTRFEILGGVAARQDDWAADLSRQQQHLLAVLVMAGGVVVGRERLEEVLWDFRTPYPEHGVERVASELRRELRRASPDGDPVPACDGGYCLRVTQEQADVLRFRAMCAEARRAKGAESLELMQRALGEWGPEAAGLHGGHPLRGLRGQWADSTRHTLRTEYRDTVIHYLTQGMGSEHYVLVLDQCEQRAADDPQTLRDEKFIELWMRAAAHTRDLARAHTVYRRARDAAEHAGERPSPFLHQLDAQLRADGFQFGAPSATASSKSIPVAAGRRPSTDRSAAENTERPPETGQTADGQPSSVINGDVYLNAASLLPRDTGKVQAQVIVARDQGTAFGAQGGNVYHYQGIPQHLLPKPGTSDGDSSERRTEPA